MHWLRAKSITPWVFVIVVWVVFSLTVGIVQFHDVPVSDFYSTVNTVLQFGMWAFITLGLILLLNINKWVFALVFPALFTVCGALCYFDVTYGIKLTAVIIEVTMLNASGAMAWSLISPTLVAVVSGSLVLGVALAVIRCRWVKEYPQLRPYEVIGVVVMLLPLLMIKRIEWVMEVKLPFSLFYSTKEYLASRRICLTERHTYDSTDVVADPSLPMVVVVIGESLRADHLPMNGYHRNTMPRMSREKNLVSFPGFYTEYFFTDKSVPHLLTRQRPENPEAAQTEQSFITLYKRGGYQTAWFANQDISLSYSYFAHEADTLAYCNAVRTVYSFEHWLDTDLLTPIAKWMAPKGTRMAVVHTIGSHWWYPSHFAPEDMHFKPVISHKEIRGLDNKAIINSYDNTIVATDRFLKRLIDMLSAKNAVVFFVSDHGEALGEGGVYLHGADSPPTHNPAMMVWWSELYGQTFPDKVAALKNNCNAHIGNKHVFNTIIDLGALKTPAYDSTQSLASPHLKAD